ncbi:MAG: response regulator transcription factor [Chloroflexi bacterium]|nr:response regulator transcription factor [Chloroflexota bacterium]
MKERTVLIVEDDRTLSDVLKYNLTREGYRVVNAFDGAQALELARRDKPDIVVLDVMLPQMSGLEVCRILRKEMSVPILMLSAKGEEVDKIVGLELGADDYVTKPFSMRELLARVAAMFRRAEAALSKACDEEAVIRAGELQIDNARRLATLDGSVLDLTTKEFSLLSFLARNRGVVFNREQLLEKVWGYDFPGDTRTVDVHIRWLRKKIETDPGKPKRLITVRGIGYKLEG